MEDLAGATFRNLMAGDGLLLDARTIGAYIDEMVDPPPSPRRDPAAVARGKALFESSDAACSTCHAGPQLTDRRSYAVLDPMSLSADDRIQAVDTPALRGLAARRGLFHDGRARDLNDLLIRNDARNHGNVSKLSDAERADLIRYMETL